MRFRSMLVITFLVPILDILASVGAAPSSFRSRDTSDAPITLVDFAAPTVGQAYYQTKKMPIQCKVNFVRSLATSDWQSAVKDQWTIEISMVTFGADFHLQSISLGNYSIGSHNTLVDEQPIIHTSFQYPPGIPTKDLPPATLSYKYSDVYQGVETHYELFWGGEFMVVPYG
ncbi:hypothetical protein BC826DRAFT_1025114 [Russula brevipes]|nr:hypothetical protein BC826DRAFT_1025114 [Russula brevipes]